MDLLDLELDLHVESNTSTPTPRSSNAGSAEPPVTSASASTAPKPKATPKTPKTRAAESTSTPKTGTRSSARNPPAAATETPIEVKKEVKVEEPEPTESPHCTSTDRDSRSLSLDKRSRNKSKKRFSPSPIVNKKRKTLLTPKAAALIAGAASSPAPPHVAPTAPTSAPSSSSTSSVIPPPGPHHSPSPSPDITYIRIASEDDFAAGIQEFSKVLKNIQPEDFQLPDNFAGEVEEEKKRLAALRALGLNEPEAPPARGRPPGKAKTQSAAKSKNGRKDTSVATAVRFKLRHSAANMSSTTKDDVTTQTSSSTPGKTTTDGSGMTPRTRPIRTPNSKYMDESIHEPASSKKNTPRQTNAGEAPRESQGRGRPRKSLAGSQKKPAPDGNEPIQLDDKDIPGPAPPPLSLPKDPAVFKLPKHIPKTPTTPTTPAAKIGGNTRSSGRVSKPNRLYADESFNTEILGRKTITEQNEVLEAQIRDATPEVETPVPSMSSPAPRVSFSAKKKPVPKEVVPKPVAIVNGVLRGYVPSTKVPLEDIEVDGVVEKLNDVVNGLMDTLLFKVCGDGVHLHENIDPKVVQAKKLAKGLKTRQAKYEARKLDIQMRHSNSNDDLGKRKRQAPKTDYFYYAPQSKKGEKLTKEASKEEKEETPEEEYVPRDEQKRQQAARQSISHMFDSEMDASLKEAKKSAIAFEKFLTPKITAAKKKTGINLMNFQKTSALKEDFFYHELLTEEKPSPTNSNIENQVEEDVNIEDVDSDDEVQVTDEVAIGMRTEALDIAEQIDAFLPRPIGRDGNSIPIQELRIRTMEQTEHRKSSLQLAIDIITNQLSFESTPANHSAGDEYNRWYTITCANARALKNLYVISCPERVDAITWVHQFLVENLPVHVLASYLSVLRHARRIFQHPSRFAFIIQSTDEIDEEWNRATTVLANFVNKRISEPIPDQLNPTIPLRSMKDTVFLLVPPTMAPGAHGGISSSSHSSQSRPRQHGMIFKWLQLIGSSKSEVVYNDESFDRSSSVAEQLSDGLIEKICNKVKQKTEENPHHNVVLVGYGASTYLIHRAANLVPGIAAIISIGFPVMTRFGRRGTADDEILLTYSPTLFIVGAEGQRFNNVAMNELRSSMATPSGLVVVGQANDLLIVPTSTLLRLNITQKVVFRMVLEKIINFLSMDVIRHPVKDELAPVILNNIYELDSSMLKSEKALSGLAFAVSPSTAATASSVGSSGGRRATVSGTGDDPPPKKKKQESHHKIAPVQTSYMPQSVFGSHASLPPPSAAAQGRFDAFQTLVAATVATADDMPRRASMGSSPRVIERGDFRDRAAAIAASRLPPPPPPVPRGPIDPATISLN